MSVLLRPLTYEDLAEMPNDGNRYEIINGELCVSPSAATPHQRVINPLQHAFFSLVLRGGRGEIFVAPYDVVLSPYDTVQPDLLYVGAERAHIVGDKRINGAPDLVVEVMAPSSRGYDGIRKAALYARSGVPEFWLVDPIARRVTIYTLVDGRYEEVPQPGAKVTSLVLPDLDLTVASVFAWLTD